MAAMHCIAIVEAIRVVATDARHWSQCGPDNPGPTAALIAVIVGFAGSQAFPIFALKYQLLAFLFGTPSLNIAYFLNRLWWYYLV